MDNPRPQPSPRRSARSNRPKISCRNSIGTPWPRSITLIVPISSTSVVIRPPFGEYFIAFSTRFRTACSRAWALPRTTTGLSIPNTSSVRPPLIAIGPSYMVTFLETSLRSAMSASRITSVSSRAEDKSCSTKRDMEFTSCLRAVTFSGAVKPSN